MATRRAWLAGAAAATAAVVSARLGRTEEFMSEEPWLNLGLAGTFARPSRPLARVPVALILAGSGPTDRNGNGPLIKTDTYRQLAAALAQSGIASLRYDKRGIGESADLVAREDGLRFEDLVEDAAAAVRDLIRSFGASDVVIVGHSEGALIAIRAALHTRVAGLVLLVAPGRPLAVILREQLDAAPMPEDLRREALEILAALSEGRRVETVSSDLLPVFRPSVQPYLASKMNIDPAAELARTSLPVLLVYGARDLQITLADRDALQAAGSDVRVVTLAEANHLLKRAPADRAGNVATYTDPSLPLDPGVMPPVIDFFRSLVR
jgi:uncharacterized protein